MLPGAAGTVRATAALAGRGLLRVNDPLLAAQHLNWLILSIPVNHAMFHGRDDPPTLGELEHYADEAVRVFLAAYGSTSPNPAS